MSTITCDEFIDAIREAVNQRGADFVYPEEWKHSGGCLYYVETPLGTTEGACIVGKAIEIATGTVYMGYNGSAPDVLIEEYGMDDDTVVNAAFVAQRAQDMGKTWGEALAAFEAYLTAGPVEQDLMVMNARHHV